MARSTLPLKDTQIKQTKPKEKEYNLSDGDGLMLRVLPSSRKVWIFNYLKPHTKTRTNIKIGTYPEVPLAEARKIRAEYRALLAINIDPKTDRENKAQQTKESLSNTFRVIAGLWIENKKREVKASTLLLES